MGVLNEKRCKTSTRKGQNGHFCWTKKCPKNGGKLKYLNFKRNIFGRKVYIHSFSIATRFATFRMTLAMLPSLSPSVTALDSLK